MSIYDKITQVTGLSKAVQDEVWQEVKINNERLNGCPGPHDFSVCLDRHTKQPVDNPTPAQKFGAYWRCTRCHGRVSGTDKSWYEKGLKHAP